jgi:prepilin-type N-terminal cleavage/methylation domain-containing protein
MESIRAVLLTKSRRQPVSRIHRARGFTLLELLVVLAIIGIITVVTLTSQSTFNRTITLANTAYDIGLTFRYAETYGIGTRALGATANTGYGLHFQKGVTESFIFFADTYPPTTGAPLCHASPMGASAPDAKPGNCIYDANYGEKVTSYQLGNGITVSDFCAYTPSGWQCANSGTGSLSSLDLVYARPNPDAFIRYNGSYSAVATAACITVASATGNARYISVAASGEINARAGEYIRAAYRIPHTAYGSRGFTHTSIVAASRGMHLAHAELSTRTPLRTHPLQRTARQAALPRLVSGFTLIELIVSLGLFALIMTLASGAYLMMISYNQQAQAEASGVNNLSFALESMAREIRTGTGYNCAAPGGGDCAGGRTTFYLTNTSGQSVEYTLAQAPSGAYYIVRAVNGVSSPLTDPTTVSMKYLTFYVTGTSRTDAQQPHVTIVVSGTVQAGATKTVPFVVETGATMRNIDL